MKFYTSPALCRISDQFWSTKLSMQLLVANFSVLRGLITHENRAQSFTSYRENQTSSLLFTSPISQPLPVLPVGVVATL